MAKNVRYNEPLVISNGFFFHIFYFYWSEENLRYTLNFDIQRFVISRFHCIKFGRGRV